MRLLGLQGTARLDAAAPPAHLAGFLGCTPDPGPGPGGLPGDLVPLAGVLAQLRPRDGTVQAVVLRLVASLPTGDVTLLLSDLAEGFTFEEGLTDAVTFGWTVPASAGGWVRGALGYETTWKAPPPGLSRLRLELVYTTAAGVEAVYVLVTNGVSQRSKRSISREGHLLEIEALGTWGRYDRERVTLSLPPRHGKAHGRIARDLALLAGVAPADIAVPPGFGAPRTAALDIVREEFRASLSDLGDSRVAVFDFDRQGRFVVFDAAPVAPPAWVFTLDQLAASPSLDLDADGEVVTCVRITGTAPELPTSADGSVTTIETVFTFAGDDYEIPGAFWRVQPGGSLAAAAGPLAAPRELIGIVETRRTTVHGCLHEEQVITFGMFAPEAARYTIAADGTLTAIPEVYLYEAGATAGDSTKAYVWQRHRLVEISRVITQYRYDDPGTLELQQTRVYNRAWFNRPAALKLRTNPADPWEGLDYLDGTLITGDGAGVMEIFETYFGGWQVLGTALAFARSTEFTDHFSEDGKLSREDVERRDWIVPPGGEPGTEYLYKDGTVSLFQTANGSISGTTARVFSAARTGGLTTVETNFGFGGEFLGQTIAKGDGDRPATPRCDESDEDRKSGRPWEVEVCAGTGSHIHVEEDISNDFIETEAEADFFGERYLRRAQAHTATLQVPVNAALVRGMPVRLYFPEAGIDLDGWIEKHRIEKGGREEPILSTLTLKLRTF